MTKVLSFIITAGVTDKRVTDLKGTLAFKLIFFNFDPLIIF